MPFALNPLFSARTARPAFGTVLFRKHKDPRPVVELSNRRANGQVGDVLIVNRRYAGRRPLMSVHRESDKLQCEVQVPRFPHEMTLPALELPLRFQVRNKGADNSPLFRDLKNRNNLHGYGLEVSTLKDNFYSDLIYRRRPNFNHRSASGNYDYTLCSRGALTDDTLQFPIGGSGLVSVPLMFKPNLFLPAKSWREPLRALLGIPRRVVRELFEKQHDAIAAVSSEGIYNGGRTGMREVRSLVLGDWRVDDKRNIYIDGNQLGLAPSDSAFRPVMDYIDHANGLVIDALKTRLEPIWHHDLTA